MNSNEIGQRMFPAELKKLPNWVGYMYGNKIPLNPRTGQAASTNDRQTWGTYAEAKAAQKKYGWDGVGFAFEPPYIGIDLDDCVENGRPNEFARRVLEACPSYTEFSPSATGLHIIAKGALSAAVKRKEIEVYQVGRYFTVTERPLQPLKLLKEVDTSYFNQFREGVMAQPFTERLIAVQEGNRNNTFTSLAGSLFKRGFDVTAVYNLLLPKAKEVGMMEGELQTICRSVGRYHPAPIASSNTIGTSIESFLEDIQTVKWICEPLIAERSIGFVAGLPETLKTWLLIDLAVAAAAKSAGLDFPWLGKFAVRPTRTLFIDQERFKGETQRRFRAVIEGKELTPMDLKGHLFLRCGSSTRLDLQHSFDAFHKELADIKPGLVIVDSFATFHTKEDNNRKDIQEVMERIKSLRDEFGCTFIFIEHENKGIFQAQENGEAPNAFKMVGSIAKPAAAEFVLTVRRQDPDSSLVYHTKSTLASTVPPFLARVTDMVPDKSKIKVEVV